MSAVFVVLRCWLKMLTASTGLKMINRLLLLEHEMLPYSETHQSMGVSKHFCDLDYLCPNFGVVAKVVWIIKVALYWLMSTGLLQRRYEIINIPRDFLHTQCASTRVIEVLTPYGCCVEAVTSSRVRSSSSLVLITSHNHTSLV